VDRTIASTRTHMSIRRAVTGAWTVVAAMALFTASAGATTWSATSTRATTPAHATKLGALPASRPLTLALGLRLRNAGKLATLAKQVNTPGNSQFGHYLTPAAFLSGYAPTAAQVHAVTTYLQHAGLAHVTVASNRMYVTADATAGQAERAFDTSLARYSQFKRTVFANTAPAKVPASLSGTVVSVLGLNNLSASPLATPTLPLQVPPLPKIKPPLPAGVKLSHPLPSALPAASDCVLNPTTGDPYGLCSYDPAGFRAAYDTGSLTGSQTTIAIMAEGDLSGVVKDLRTAEKAFKEPQVPYSIVPVGVHSTDTSGADEWDLDTQYSTGIARSVKHLYIYDTTSLTDSDIGLEFNKWASQDVAKAASASFGECEVTPYADGLMVTNDQVMNEAAAQGQTMHASSGDTGGQSCAVAPTNGVPESGPPEVNYPCSSPYIVCVGGTSLFSNADGSYDTELGWVAGGGGLSTFESSPSWQACVAPSNAGGVRAVPDIAMDADENTGADVYVNGSPEDVGGTSLSSPLALGSWATVETAAQNKLGFAAPLLYHLYPTAGCQSGVPVPPTGQLGTASSDPGYPLHDVFLGNNVAYQNTFGYDLVTGLGSYDIAKASAALTKASSSG
jgi:pseudomonalisin